jgi:hypothetical protein
VPHFATIYRLADALGIEGEELIEFQPPHDRNGEVASRSTRPRSPVP